MKTTWIIVDLDSKGTANKWAWCFKTRKEAREFKIGTSNKMTKPKKLTY